jgi:hypothetical protein
MIAGIAFPSPPFGIDLIGPNTGAALPAMLPGKVFARLFCR